MSTQIASDIIKQATISQPVVSEKPQTVATRNKSVLDQFSRTDLMTPVPKSVETVAGYKVVTFPDGRQFVLKSDGTPFVSERDVPQDLKDKIRGGSFGETRIEIDHIVPKGLGGTDAESNLQPLENKLTPWQWIKSKLRPNKEFEVGDFKPENRQSGKMVVEQEAIDKYRNGDITYWEAMAAVQHWDNKEIRDSFLHNEVSERAGFFSEAIKLLNPVNQIKKSATGFTKDATNLESFIKEKVSTAYKQSVLSDLVKAVNPATTQTIEDRIALISGVSRGMDDPLGGIQEGETVEGLAGQALLKNATGFLFGPSAIPYTQTTKREESALASTPIRWTAGSLARLVTGYALEKTGSDMHFTPYTDNQKFLMGEEEFTRISNSSDIYGMADRYIAKTLEDNGVESTRAQKIGLTGAIVLGVVFENPFFSVGGKAGKEALEKTARELLEHELGGELSELALKNIGDEVGEIVKISDEVTKKQAFQELVGKYNTPQSLKVDSTIKQVVETTDPLIQEAKKYDTIDEFVNLHKVYHGGDKNFIQKVEKTRNFNPTAKRDAGTGGNFFGLSTSTNYQMAKDFSTSSTADPFVGEFFIDPTAKTYFLKNKSLDDLSFTETKKISEKYDIIIDVDNVGGENEIRILNPGVLRDESQIISEFELSETGLRKENDFWINNLNVSEPEIKPVRKTESVLETPEVKQAIDEMDSVLKNESDKVPLFLRGKKTLERVSTRITKAVQDDWVEIKKLVEKGAGDADPYLKKVLFPGRVGARIEEVAEQTRNVLKDRIKTANSLKIDSDKFKQEINQYLIAKHAPERNAAVSSRLSVGATPEEVSRAKRAAGLSTEEAEATLKDLENLPYFSEIERLAGDIQAMNKQTLEVLVKGEVISKELFDSLTKRYKNHVPLNRIFDETEDVTSALTSKGFDVASSGVKTAKGSEREVSDILGNVVANLEQAVARSEKNRVNLEVLKFARENKELGLFEEVKPKLKGKDFDGKPLYDHQTMINDPQVLTIREQGKNVYIKIKDKDLAVTIKGLGREKLPAYLKYIAMYSRFMASLATRFNPDFAFSNKIRDIQETLTYVASQKEMGFGGALKVAGQEMKFKGLRDVIAGLRGQDTEGAKLYRQMINDGGTTGGLGLSTKKQLELDMNKIESTIKSKPRQATKYMLDKVDDWNTIFEDSTRLSVYRQALNNGQSREQAARLAKEASIDFNRMGTMSPVLNSLYMFSNASFQGSFKMLSAMKNPKVAGTVVATVGGAVFITNEWNDNIDPYWRDKVTKWDRTSNLVLMLPPGDDGSANYLLIPVSWGIKPIKVAADEVYDLSSGIEKDIGDAFNGVLVSVLEGYNPVGGTDIYSALTPTVGDLPSELARNKSWSGSKIKPDWDKNISPSRQYFDSLRDTRRGRGLISVTRFIDDKLGIRVSPEDVDYAINSLVGGAGRFVGKTYETISSIGKDEFKADEAPFTGRFFRSRTEDEFSGGGDVPEETKEALREQANIRFDTAERAELLWDEIKDSDNKEELLSKAAETESEEVISKMVEIAEEEALNLTYADKQIKQLGVENGARAQRIYEMMETADSREEALNIVRDYLEKEIITENVAGQLADLLIAEPLAVLAQ